LERWGAVSVIRAEGAEVAEGGEGVASGPYRQLLIDLHGPHGPKSHESGESGEQGEQEDASGRGGAGSAAGKGDQGWLRGGVHPTDLSTTGAVGPAPPSWLGLPVPPTPTEVHSHSTWSLPSTPTYSNKPTG